MALSIDGQVGNFIVGVGTIFTLPTLTCSNSGNVICVAIMVNHAVGGGPILSVVGSGATFTNRAIFTFAAGLDGLELWTGFASGTFNAAITITDLSSGYSFISAQAFGINGAPSSSYFDTNGALPETGGSDPGTISTSNANDIILGFFRTNGTLNPTAGTGFTTIRGDGYMLSEYKLVSSTQSSLSIPMGTGAGDANGFIGDAIIASGTTPVTKSFGLIAG